jgi:small subunit ribosomal protein S6
LPPNALDDLNEEYTRDVDILRRKFIRLHEPEKFECSLDDELQPPAYRKEVIEMMRIAARGQKEKYPQNTGLKYYPFQK